MQFYQWLLEQNGFIVSNTGYFVYTTGDNTLSSFNNELKFRTNLIAHIGSRHWVENTLDDLINCASSSSIPASAKTCPYCSYVNARKNIEL